MLQAERSQRERAERAALELKGVLLEAALKVDGERLESLRRDDPSIPGKWEAVDWSAFFKSVNLVMRGWGSAVVDDASVLRLRREHAQQMEAMKASVQKLEQGNLQLREALETQRTISSAVAETAKTGLSPAPQGATPSYVEILSACRLLKKVFRQKIPTQFAKLLSGGERAGSDLSTVLERYWIEVYLIGHYGLAAVQEIEALTGDLTNAVGGTTSLKRAMQDLSEATVLAGSLSLENPNSVLKVVSLTETGQHLFQAMFGEAPLENEWERLNRLHEGAKYPEHTLAALAFAMHARKRGWATQVLPENPKSDLCLFKDGESLRVEVELSPKERGPKRWPALAKINDGRVALCAGTVAVREALVKQAGGSGFAADLETLLPQKYLSMTEASPLWSRTW
jgi:hypothetical protein